MMKIGSVALALAVSRMRSWRARRRNARRKIKRSEKLTSIQRSSDLQLLLVVLEKSSLPLRN